MTSHFCHALAAFAAWWKLVAFGNAKYLLLYQSKTGKLGVLSPAAVLRIFALIFSSDDLTKVK